MIGQTISHYKILEKLGEGDPTAARFARLRRIVLVHRFIRRSMGKGGSPISVLEIHS